MERTINAPASKSVSHRAVIAASLALGKSTLHGVLESRDLERTRELMANTGARITSLGEPGSYEVHGTSGFIAGGADAPIDMNVGESGTTCRLLTGVMAAGNGQFRVFGEGRMHDRPIGEIVDTIRLLGAEVIYEEKDGYPPFVLRAAGMKGGLGGIGMDESSQYLSGLLLAAPLARQPLTLEIRGEKVVSWPYVGLTLHAMQDFGITFAVYKKRGDNWEEVDWRNPGGIEPHATRIKVNSGMYMGREDYQVEGDWSNGSYFLAAGALGPDAVRVKGLRRDTLQGDAAICDILERMGARVTWDGDDVVVAPPADGKLQGIEVDMGDSPDLVPGVAAVAAQAEGVTVIRNVAHLRIKESDRLAAPAGELAKAGAEVEVLDDGLKITPAPLRQGPVEFSSHNDHRMAMSLALLTLGGVEPRFDDPSVVAKSFPGFWDEWAKVAGDKVVG